MLRTPLCEHPYIPSTRWGLETIRPTYLMDFELSFPAFQNLIPGGFRGPFEFDPRLFLTDHKLLLASVFDVIGFCGLLLNVHVIVSLSSLLIFYSFLFRPTSAVFVIKLDELR